METNNTNKPNTSPSSPLVPTGTGAVPDATPKQETTPPPASAPPGASVPAKPLSAAAPTPVSAGAASQAAGAKPGPRKPADKICWRSEDGLVTVAQKVSSAGRFPPHGYPVIVLECIAKEGQRIRRLPNGGLEIMLNHLEIEQYLQAIAAADSKVRYEVVQRVPTKDPARKAYWDGINAARHQRKSRGQTGDGGLSR